MPPEPDNKMDELLKAYAKKRRNDAGEPMELHPATRRILQAEAAILRPAAAPEPKSWLTTLRMFWPRLAFAAAIVAVGGIAIFSLYPPRSGKNDEMYLAKQDSESLRGDRYFDADSIAAPSRSLAPPAPMAAKPAEGPAVALSDEAKTKDKTLHESLPTPALAVADNRAITMAEKSEALTKSVAPAPMRGAVRASDPAIAAPPAPASEPASLSIAPPESAVPKVQLAKELKLQSNRAEEVQIAGAVAADQKQQEVLVTSKAKVAAPAAMGDAPAALAPQKPDELSQQLKHETTRGYFSQTLPAARPATRRTASTPETPVLQKFAVEQSGEVVRVVDGDGSVYEGKIIASNGGATMDTDSVDPRSAGQQDGARLRRDLSELEGRQQQAQTRFSYQRANSEAQTAWNFRVTGTNRTLKQPVTIEAAVFNGILVTNGFGGAGAATAGQSLNFYRNVPGQAPNTQVQQPATVTTAPAQANGAAAVQYNTYNSQLLNLSNAQRIQGNYRIGLTNQRVLDALRDGN